MASTPPTPIEDYALLGDLHTAALVSTRGSVDWLCLPNFDSPACFAALVGTPENGRWLIGPTDPEARSSRHYLTDSFVLETVHETASGRVRVTDFMPVQDQRADLVRVVEGLEGSVRMTHEWTVRFGYGATRPWVSRHVEDLAGATLEVITAVAGPDMLVLRGTRLPHPEDGHHRDEFDVAAGEVLTFATTWVPSYAAVPASLPVRTRLEETLKVSREWAEHSRYAGPYADAVTRSLLVLRVLSHEVTGGIVAAPTTSLPEDFGGERNWDYRYCWLRDASLTLEALLDCGYRHETRLWRNWLLRAAAGDPEDLQIMYRIDGGRELPERELPHLAGYAGSRPVRVGNAAVGQQQTDVLGEVMIALESARHRGIEETADSWRLQQVLVDQLADRWDDPDNGLWEIRGPVRHFTHSRVMVWVALDRAVRAVEEFGFDGPVERWRELRARVRAEVLAKGYNEERQTFVQHFDTTEVDASLLMLSAVGFVDGDDPRMLGTIAAVERDLLRDGLVLRYRTATGVDGLSGDEHPFLACSFWLVTAYARAGLTEKATALMDRLLGLANDLGLLSEEYDPTHGRMVGNFPQAFSHLALVGAALALADPTGKAGHASH